MRALPVDCFGRYFTSCKGEPINYHVGCPLMVETLVLILGKFKLFYKIISKWAKCAWKNNSKTWNNKFCMFLIYFSQFSLVNIYFVYLFNSFSCISALFLSISLREPLGRRSRFAGWLWSKFLMNILLSALRTFSLAGQL